MQQASGVHVRLVHPGGEATIVAVGGGLRTCRLQGREVLSGYPEAESAPAGRGQILVPWPNRLGDGRYEFGGRSWELPLTDREGATAIHGLLRWSVWRLEQQSPDRATARVDLPPQPGWPTWLSASVEYRLGADGLRVTMAATNSGQARCPFGAAMHPYLLPTGPFPTARLLVPAVRWLRTDQRGLPAGWQPVAGSEHDFRAGRVVGDSILDTCYAMAPGGWQARFDDLELWASPAFGYVQVFTGDTDPDRARRRTALALEPATCPPDAFRTGEGLLVLNPGERWQGEWGLRVITAPGVPPR